MRRRSWLDFAAVTTVLVGLAGGGNASEPTDIGLAVRAAAAAYADAFNRGDYAALADQWVESATLAEGSSLLEGRAAIAASIRRWREGHPGCSMTIKVEAIEPIAEPLARVSGTLSFIRTAGGKPVVSRFSTLRVKEGETWRILESVVVPPHAAALDDLEWMVGTWHAESGDAEQRTKTTIETIYEKPLGPYCLVGRSRIRPPAGDPIEALEIIQADRDTGLVRSWVFDSTGARGEGVIESDGATLHKTMIGTPADTVAGSVARWTQVVSPAGDSRCTMHSIERSIDGEARPDAEPLHFRKIR
jgi:ketosteroid isomerase-like protein